MTDMTDRPLDPPDYGQVATCSMCEGDTDFPAFDGNDVVCDECYPAYRRKIQRRRELNDTLANIARAPKSVDVLGELSQGALRKKQAG